MFEIDDLFITGKTTTNYDTSHFKLPIELNEHGEINDIVKSDLEMTIRSNIYTFLIDDSLLIHKWSSFYSSNKYFLKDTQCHIKHYPKSDSKPTMLEEYTQFKEENNFIDRYQYISFKYLKPLNDSSLFLQCLGIFNLSTPVFSLLSPLFVLIVPFLMLKIRGIPITISMYIGILKQLLQKNSLYHLFTNFNSISAQQKMSSVASIMFYIFQVYSNVMSCITFYKNTHSISSFINNYKSHLQDSLTLMNKVQSSVLRYKTYIPFYNEISLHKLVVEKLLLRFDVLLPYNNTFSKLSQLGQLMSLYHDIYFNDEYHRTFMYSIYLNQYDKDISALNNKVREKKIHKCRFSSVTKMRHMYYLPHLEENPVKNHIHLEKNIIITGPNASGKTTILKAAMINVLMSQQFGYGCYKSASIKLYDMFHSYLNIPDTSGRDSLFQAEARRCKDILECIHDQSQKNHFCIFDEIYSGTNPNDAVLCANLYLKGMNHFKENVDYMLTTHYIQLCENFKEDKLISNLKMNVEVTDESISYLYSIVPGISYIHGGKHILKNLNYPEYLFQL
jgi:energy-coupling factor transporter ATP-binding protein EcfA2